jgi:hypothetical protein
VTAEVKDRIVQGKVFYIPYEELAAGTKITNTTFDLHPNSTFAGMQVTITDTTGVVAANIVKSALTVAAASQGFPVTLGPAPTPGAAVNPGIFAAKATDWCNENTVELRKTVNTKKQDLADLSKSDKDIKATKI